jgi:hypothetical protein
LLWQPPLARGWPSSEAQNGLGRDENAFVCDENAFGFLKQIKTLSVVREQSVKTARRQIQILKRVFFAEEMHFFIQKNLVFLFFF